MEDAVCGSYAFANFFFIMSGLYTPKIMQIDVIKYKAVFTKVYCFSDVNMEMYTSGLCVHLKSSPLAWRILDCRRIMFIMRDLYLLLTSLGIVLAFFLDSKYVPLFCKWRSCSPLCCVRQIRV